MEDLPKLQFNQLHKADIILTTQRNHIVSAGIRAATNSAFSHSMLVTKYDYIIEAHSDGVEERPWNLAKQGATLAVVMRHKDVFREVDQDKIVTIAKSYEGRKYDYAGAAGSGLVGNKRNQALLGGSCLINLIGCSVLVWQINKSRTPVYLNDRFFCSELVSRAYSNAGFPLINGKPTDVSPCGVYNSAVLKTVGYLINIPPPQPTDDYPGYRRAKTG